MAQPDIPRGLVQRAINEGLNATDALRRYRDAGGSVRTQTWYRLYGQARAAMGQRAAEANRPLHRIPTAGEVQVMTTRRARGFLHHMEAYLRDPSSGVVVSQPISIRVDRLRSRRWAIQRALDALRDQVTKYALSPVAVIHTGTFEMQPEEEGE